MTTLPLAGVRVLDLSRILAGPVCAMLLGDLGADVVKLERPGTGDDTRSWGPPFLSGGESAYFMSANRNKRGIAVDLGTAEGREVLARLIQNSDVVVENFKAGTLESWGFDAAFFKESAPRTVRTTISGYGSYGPRAGAPGYDFIAQAESGLMSISGEPDGEPVKMGVAIVDLCTGFLACIGTLAALTGRDASIGVSHVETNLHDTGVALLANVAAGVLASGVPAQRLGNGHPNIVPYRTYQAADGWLAVAVGNDTQFERFCRVLGLPDSVRSPWHTNPERVRDREALDRRLEQIVAAKSKDHWVDVLRQAGIPVGTVNDVGTALSSDHAQARRLVETIDHVTAGLCEVVRAPIDLDGEALPVRRPPPALGQHTVEVLVGDLGLPESRVRDLLHAGSVSAPGG